MSDSTNISRARRDLFELVDRVLDSDEAVFIRHRDRSERVAMVRESRLKYLEALRDPHPGHPERMEGTRRGRVFGRGARGRGADP